MMKESHHPEHYRRRIFELEIDCSEGRVIVEYPGGNRYAYTMDEDVCEYVRGEYEEIVTMTPASANTSLGPLIKYIKDNSSDWYQL